MKLHTLLLSTAVAVMATAATAADMVYEEPLPPIEVVPQWDWAGPYLGLHGGWGVSDADSAYNDTEFNSPNCGLDAPIGFPGAWSGCPVDLDPDGAFVGVQAGWNFVFGNGLMIGIEGDYSAASLKDEGEGSFISF